MRAARSGLLCSFFLITASSWGQQVASTTQPQGVQSPQVQKDAAASTILVQMAAAIGWSSASLPSDVTAQATVRRYSGDTLDLQNAFGAIYKLRGLNQARIEYNENGLTSTAIVNGRAGVILSPDGKKQVLPGQAVIGMKPNIFPFFTDIGQTLDASVSIQYSGIQTVKGEPCHGIMIARQPDPSDLLAPTLKLASPITVWVSTTNFLPVQVDYIRLAADNQYVVVHFTRTYSDYRTVNGMAVAFLQEESVEGQKMYRTQLTNVQFNSGLLDADFALPRI